MTAPNSAPLTPDGSLTTARAQADRVPTLSPAGEWLVFATHGTKLYAKTPTGEYAFGDVQGLYEWRRPDPEGRAQRIDHTGGDRVGAKAGKAIRAGGDGSPSRRGLTDAMLHHRRN